MTRPNSYEGLIYMRWIFGKTGGPWGLGFALFVLACVVIANIADK